MVTKVVHLFIMIAVFVSVGFAQDARLSGSVMDLVGAVIPEAKVEVTCSDGAAYQSATGADGVFDIKLKGGLCRISVSKPPFDPTFITGYFVPHNNSMKIDIALQCVECELIEEDFLGPPTIIEMRETDSYKGFNILNRQLIKQQKHK